jgi:hypothetical protein
MRRLANADAAFYVPADYEKHLNEAVDILMNLKFPRQGLLFDKTFWNARSGTYGGSADVALELRIDKKPHKAIEAMFGSISAWALDCARFVQVAHWYAMLHTLGSKHFDKFISVQARQDDYPSKAMVLLPEKSTGILTNIKAGRMHFYQRGIPVRSKTMLDTEHLSVPLDEVLANAPLGSCVSFAHLAAKPGTPFRIENTLMLGSNIFAAHGYGRDTNKFTMEEVIQYLNETVMTSIASARFSEQETEQARQKMGSDSNVFLHTIRYYDIQRMSQF